jgi:aminoglycoside phosphotransferase family enzyme/predicted kinase
MELSRIIDELSRPAAYPQPVDKVEVRQTHISAVFLAGDHVYKIKKPVSLGFLDFGTLDARRHFCHEEVRLNRRLAPRVYLGVVPIVGGDGGVRIDQPGEPIEWAVKMQRLDDDATLESRLERDEPIEAAIEKLAVRLAQFHAAAERGPHIAQFGSFAVVERNALENFEQAAPHVGKVVSPAVFERLRELTVAELDQHKGLIEARAQRGVPCDTHGDLRLGHVYWMPELAPPDDLVVIDCIEFNERFRYADPVADMAFMAMGLARSGRRDLERLFVEAYFRASGDVEGRALLPLYVAYRAAVRGKVDAMQAARAEIPSAERGVALSKARGYWLSALGALELPERRPCLILVGGLPGTGKSTLAAELAARSGFELIRSDLVRKELAGKLATSDASATFEQGIYTPEWTERTYAECLRRAEEHLFAGHRVVVDASFRQDTPRSQFLEAAAHWGVPAMLWVCQADTEVVRQRITARRGDASDADWSIHQQAAARWETAGSIAQRALTTIDTTAGHDTTWQQAQAALRSHALAP